jgi:hypothetical protein
MAPQFTPMASFRAAMLNVSCAHTIIAHKTNDKSILQANRQIKVHSSGEVHDVHDAWLEGESQSCCSG